jgi:hypothetical protein
LAKHRTDLTRGLPLPSTWVNALMEFVGSSHANFRVSQITDTAIFVSAGTGNDQVAIAIGGKWRFNTATVTAVHPGGAAGTYDAFGTATSMPNVFPYRATRPGAAGTDDQDIPGLTPEWRLSLAWIVNTNPATTFKVGLVDASALATPTTGANLVMPTLAPSFSSPLSTFSVTLDATSGSNGQFWSTPVQETLGLFTIGHNYMLAVQIGTMAANSYLGLDVKLQRRFR